MKLSVIVPIYNVEKFLSRCLDSLLRQGMKPGEYEVICVNDGSTDNCAAILEEYRSKYPDIFKVITQKNKGLGEARNMGMRMAKGMWIGFVDSDDYVIDYGFRYLLDHFCMKENDNEIIDVIHYNYRDIYTDGRIVFDPDAKPDGVITFEGDGVEAYNQYPMMCVWTKIYRRAFLLEHNIWSQNFISEDELFNFDVFSHHPHLHIVNSCIYRYERGNKNSVMTTTRKKIVLVQLKGLLYDMEYINNYLKEGKTSVAPAAQRTISILRSTFYKIITSVCLSSKEWNYYHQRLKKIPLQPIDSSNGRRSIRWLATAKRTSVTSYPFYVFLYLAKRCFFKSYSPIYSKEIL